MAWTRTNLITSVLGLLMSLFSAVNVSAQSVNREAINGLLNEGEIAKAEAALTDVLRRSEQLTYLDSLYIFKNLGVLYASQPKKQAKADELFNSLLTLDPYASLHDTYASNTIIARFKKIRKSYQQRIGGKALVPTLAVFDLLGPDKDLNGEERIALTHQMIVELQRLSIFHTLDRGVITEALNRMRQQPEACQARECRLDMARRLTAEKMATVELGRLNGGWTVHLTLIDVETGQTSTTLNQIFEYGDIRRLAEEGFAKVADSLQKAEAAWFNLTLSPSNATLEVDGSPLASLTSRLPLNPGKHKLCAQSPGYQGECKEFTVKKNDAVTYAFLLQPVGNAKEFSQKKTEDFIEEDEFSQSGASAPPSRIIWWTLGGMSALALVLVLVLNSKD